MRSETRHQSARAKARALRRARLIICLPATGGREQRDRECREWARRNYRDRKPCSCLMCCNPRRRPGRRSETLSLAERRANLSDGEQLQELRLS